MTPERQLRAMFVVDTNRRMTASPEPNTHPPPLFALIRGASSCAWAVRADVPGELAAELDRLAGEEPPIADLRAEPIHANDYRSMLRGQVVSGPAFTFPDQIARPADVALIDKLELLERHFRGWIADEIRWRVPIVAVMDDGYPVSVCFCATRNSEPAIEAGLETAADFRRRGFGARVTAAWASAIRASGRIPLYSTSWSNTASLAVARKLGLVQYASDWSVVSNPHA